MAAVGVFVSTWAKTIYQMYALFSVAGEFSHFVNERGKLFCDNVGLERAGTN